MSFLKTNILDSIEESAEFNNDSVFKNKDLIVKFNGIMDNIKKYADTEFKCVPEAVKVQHMKDGSYVCEMDELAEYMEANEVGSLEEAVATVCEVNGIDSLALAVDEDALMEAKAAAAKASKLPAKHVCSGCGKDIAKCTCESYKEEVHPDIEMFESLVETIAYCEAAGIPVVLKKARSL